MSIRAPVYGRVKSSFPWGFPPGKLLTSLGGGVPVLWAQGAVKTRGMGASSRCPGGRVLHGRLPLPGAWCQTCARVLPPGAGRVRRPLRPGSRQPRFRDDRAASAASRACPLPPATPPGLEEEHPATGARPVASGISTSSLQVPVALCSLPGDLPVRAAPLFSGSDQRSSLYAARGVFLRRSLIISLPA